jgi:hypothetical protein
MGNGQKNQGERVRTVLRTGAERLWLAVAVMTVVLWFYPVEYQITRVVFTVGVVTTWAGGMILWWRRKVVRGICITVGLVGALVVCLPGRPIKADGLAVDYVRALRFFEGARYVWGGESRLGIDCSGLIRKGMIWGQFRYGLQTFNGGPIRNALDLWWHDSSAQALRDGYRGWTTRLFEADGIAQTDHARLKAGDLAVTADGVHILAYLGNREWIEADPGMRKVIKVSLPTNNGWFNNSVIFLRWKWLEETSPTNPAVPFPSKKSP